MLYFDAVIYLSTYVLELQFEMVIVLLVVDGKACVYKIIAGLFVFDEKYVRVGHLPVTFIHLN